MKKTGLIFVAVLVTIFMAGADMVTALEPVPMESGFSGFIRPRCGKAPIGSVWIGMIPNANPMAAT